MARKLRPGDAAPELTGDLVSGGTISLGDLRGRKVLLSFHRYASCPACNFWMRAYTTRHQELVDRNVVYLPVFHSPREKMREYYPELPPFEMIFNPDMSLYRKYGLQPSIWAFLHPRILKDIPRMISSILKPGFRFRISPDRTMFTRPADLLINEDGVIEVVYYGKSIGDSLEIDHVLALVDREAAAA